MITLEEKLFRLDDKNRAVIMDFLNNPVIGQAFAILTQVPSREPTFQPGVPLDTTIAHEHCKMIGANSIMKGFVRMTHKPAESPEEREDKGEEPQFEYLQENVQMPVAKAPLPQAPVVTETPKKRGRPRKS